MERMDGLIQGLLEFAIDAVLGGRGLLCMLVENVSKKNCFASGSFGYAKQKR